MVQNHDRGAAGRAELKVETRNLKFIGFGFPDLASTGAAIPNRSNPLRPGAIIRA